MIPCPTTSTIEISEGDGIDSTLLGGVYTIAISSEIRDHVDADQIYATEAARDADNPSPSSGDRAWITNDDRLFINDGTGWIVAFEPPQTYTPSPTNITVGNGTLVGSYQRSFGQCDFEASLVFGTTTSMGTAPAFLLPFATSGLRRHAFAVELLDNGTATYNGFTDIVAGGASSVPMRYSLISASLVSDATITSTLPFTWTTSDAIAIVGRFRMNSLYD